MAKNSLPMMQPGGSGALGKVMWALVVLALAVLVIKFPTDAAAFVQSATAKAGDVIGGLVSFFRALGQ